MDPATKRVLSFHGEKKISNKPNSGNKAPARGCCKLSIRKAQLDGKSLQDGTFAVCRRYTTRLQGPRGGGGEDLQTDDIGTHHREHFPKFFPFSSFREVTEDFPDGVCFRNCGFFFRFGGFGLSATPLLAGFFSLRDRRREGWALV